MNYERVFESCVNDDIDFYLDGGWFEGIICPSGIYYDEDGIEVHMYSESLGCEIVSNIGWVTSITDYGFVYKWRNIKDCSVEVTYYGSGEDDYTFKLQSKIKSTVIKFLRNLVKTRYMSILEHNHWCNINIYDGDDIIGFRG
jgi:hypothetical protein